MSEKIQDSEIRLEETAKPGQATQMVESSKDTQQVSNDRATLTTQTARITLAGFHDLNPIAEGSSGLVYSARRDCDNRLVAVKIYHKDLMPDAESIRRFEHEVDTLKRLTHPNIVKILSSGTTASGQSYIDMENVEGKNLRTILNESGAFTQKRAAVVAREVCRALTAAHESGIIHRDLKPGNIILDENNIAKVVDFGIAKAVGSSNDTITEYGAVIGTPAYMSPEQCLGQKVDERSDIYSLGCTLFELLTNEKAFDADTAMIALAKQINKDRSHLKPILEKHQIPTDLQKIVLRCLERNQEDRYSSAAELDHDLSAFLLQVPQPAGTGNWQMSKTTQLVTCVCALIAVVVIFETALFHARETIEAEPGHPAPEGSISVLNAGSNHASNTEIKNRLTGAVIFAQPNTSKKKAVENAVLRGISLAYADLSSTDLTLIELTNADLRSADLTDARLNQAKLSDVNLAGAILIRTDLSQANLRGCSFRNANLSSANLFHLQAPFTDFRDADLTKANLIQACLTNCDLRSANLSGSFYQQTKFFGSNITYTTMPSRTRYGSPDIKGCTINGVTVQ